MRLTETIETSTGPVTVRELTVGEVRQWLASMAAGSEITPDVVSGLMFDGFALEDLDLFILESTDYNALTQSEIRAIADASKRINPDFFVFRQRLRQAGQVAAEIEARQVSQVSSGTS